VIITITMLVCAWHLRRVCTEYRIAAEKCVCRHPDITQLYQPIHTLRLASTAITPRTA
jgi:hypothetical protein